MRPHHSATSIGSVAAASLILTGCTSLTALDDEPATVADNQPDDMPAGGAGEQAHVDRVVDGDTIIATIDGHNTRVRVLGIDTPETVDPRLDHAECWGPEASAFAHDTLDDQHVTLVADPTQQNTDTYDRALRYIVLDDGTDYSILAAEHGMAEPYIFAGQPVLKADEIQHAADNARDAGHGLWGACDR